MKQVAVSALNTYTSSSIAADNIGTGDAAVTIATSSGNITIDAQAGDADIIFKGTDSSSDITALTLDMSAAGAATFNDLVNIGGSSLNFTKTDGVGITAKESFSITIDLSSGIMIYERLIIFRFTPRRNYICILLFKQQ